MSESRNQVESSPQPPLGQRCGVDGEVRDELVSFCRDVSLRWYKIRTSLKGRKVEILSNYNGQPHGRSKPSQRGNVLTVRDATLDLDGSDIALQLEEFALGHPFIGFGDVKFVEDSAGPTGVAPSEVGTVREKQVRSNG